MESRRHIERGTQQEKEENEGKKNAQGETDRERGRQSRIYPFPTVFQCASYSIKMEYDITSYRDLSFYAVSDDCRVDMKDFTIC